MRNEAFPSTHCDLRFKFHCDLRSSGEGVADRRRMCHIATRCPQCPQCGRNFACGKIFPCAHAFGMGVCAITISADIAPSALGWGRDSLYPSPVIARKRAVFALRAEFLFLSFPKEKETKKKGNLRACALKDPPDCTNLLRSIKNGMLVFAVITGRALRGGIVRSGKRMNGKTQCAKE